MRLRIASIIFSANLLLSLTTSASFPRVYSTYTIHRQADRLADYATLQELNASGGATTRTWTFTYDHLNRLNQLGSAAGNYTFDYAGAAGRLLATHLPGGSVITNFFDPAGQLLGRWLKSTNGTALDAYVYTHDRTGLRTNVVRGDGTHVGYAFDGIGQLTNAVGYEAGGTLRRNEDFQYGYDAGGNLATRVNHTLTQTFGVDNANRLSSAGRSGTLTAAGTVNSLAQSLTVNGVGATIYSDNTFATTNGLTLSSGTNALIFAAKNAANQTTTYTNSYNLPATVNYTYDLNGNLTSDGSLGYEYDDANRLVRITATNQWKSEFIYDALSRRNVRRESTWNSGLGTWNSPSEVRYVWVGMLVMQERDGNNAVKVTYTRGPDLSGTMEGAGGIGGLLARTDAYSNTFYYGDGAGNITALIDSSGNVMARFRYDSFGNLLSESGPLADVNSYRFSSKEYHERSGLYYYDYRYYSPNLQRWLNEDPTREAGGMNLYGFISNDPMNWVDRDGYGGWRLDKGDHGTTPTNPEGFQIQTGDQRWDAETLNPIEHKGKIPPELTPAQIDEIRKAAKQPLDKCAKLFPNGRVAAALAEEGVTAGTAFRLSKTLAKGLCKRIALPLAVAAAVSDTKVIAQTAVTGTQAAAATLDNAANAMDTQSKVNSHLGDVEKMTDDEITHYMHHRAGNIGH